MSEYLIVSDVVAPLSEAEAAAGALGLANALAAAGHRVSVLSLAPPEVASRQSGLARRLRMVTASAGGQPVELPLFEGRPTAGSAQFFVLGVTAGGRGRTAALLGSAAAGLARDGVFAPGTVIGWGEAAAPALAAFGSAWRPFVLPGGHPGDPLATDDLAALAEADDLGAGRSLLARALIASDALLVPSASAARALSRHADLEARASDQPIAVLRLGADDPPHDPASDLAVAASYSAEAPAGKVECRRALARKLSLTLGGKTLLAATPPLDREAGGEALLTALSQLAGLDAAVVVRTGHDKVAAERAKVLAIQFPGKIALVADDSATAGREILAAADVLLLADAEDLTGRAAAVAMRYGTLPVAPDTAAWADNLVDFDPASSTGNALLYAPGDAFELVGALRRASVLRTDPDGWARIVRSLLQSAPRWTDTAAAMESLRPQSPGAEAAAPAP